MTEGRTTTQTDLEHLFAMLNHEVRTPLSALVEFVELLRPDMSPDELNDIVQRIKSSIPCRTYLSSGYGSRSSRRHHLSFLI